MRGGEQFAVVDEDGNFYGYVIAEPGMVWDNDDDSGADAQRYYEPQVDKKGNPVTCTTFKGKIKDMRSGLMITNPMPSKQSRIAARIGTKEGVEPNDAYAVYQYDVQEDKLIKKGVVHAVKGEIWDNVYYNNRNATGEPTQGELKSRGKDGLRNTETLFKGSCKIQPGMFLRKAH